MGETGMRWKTTGRPAASVAVALAALCCVAGLAAGAPSEGRAAAEDCSPRLAGWPLVVRAELPATYVTVFRWDEQSVGVLDPAAGRIAILSLAGKIVYHVEHPQLSTSPRPNRVWPDPVARTADGAVIWVSVPLGEVRVLPRVGEPVVYKTASESPFALRAASGDELEIFELSHRTGFSGYARYGKKGLLLERRPGWLRASREDDLAARRADHTRVLFAPLADRRVELSAHYPFLRVVGAGKEEVLDLRRLCSELPSSLVESFGRAAADGLPLPLGGGVAEEHIHGISALALTAADDERVHASLNGSLLLTLALDAAGRIESRCEPIPMIDGDRTGGLHASIAEVSGRLAVLTAASEKTIVRIWDTRATEPACHSSSAPETEVPQPPRRVR